MSRAASPSQATTFPPELLSVIGEHLPLGEKLRLIPCPPASPRWAGRPFQRCAGPRWCHLAFCGRMQLIVDRGFEFTEDLESSGVDRQECLSAEAFLIGGGAWRGSDDYASLMKVGGAAYVFEAVEESWAAAEVSCGIALVRHEASFICKRSELKLRAQALLQGRLELLRDEDETSVYCLTSGEVGHDADDKECMLYAPLRAEWRHELQ
eukprot:jgi/Chlat1/1148/Chrsp112S01627